MIFFFFYSFFPLPGEREVDDGGGISWDFFFPMKMKEDYYTAASVLIFISPARFSFVAITSAAFATYISLMSRLIQNYMILIQGNVF